MSSNTSNPILSFTRPRSATPPHGNGSHPCTRRAAIEQAFGTKCWSFGVTIVNGFSHSLPSIFRARLLSAFGAYSNCDQVFFAKGARQVPYSQRIDGTLI
jgi:hypothetical protein